MSKKNKNRIDVRGSKLEFESRDFTVQEMNDYQFRISCPAMEATYDWYHTSGTLVRNDPLYGQQSKGKGFGTAESVANLILERDLT